MTGFSPTVDVQNMMGRMSACGAQQYEGMRDQVVWCSRG